MKTWLAFCSKTVPLLAVAVVLAAALGCRKSEAPKKEALPKPAAQEQAVQETGKAAVPEKAPELASPEDATSAKPEEKAAPAPQAPVEEPAARTPDDTAPVAPKPPAPAIDLDRLKGVYVEMWCAERKGADPDALLQLYHRFDYPPIENWYEVWNQALLNPGWARTTVAEARARCPEVAGELKPEGADAPTAPAGAGEAAPPAGGTAPAPAGGTAPAPAGGKAPAPAPAVQP